MQFLRFLLVGLLNTAFGYACFAAFLLMGLHYSVALLLATVLGVLFNFKSTGILVFKSHDNRLIAKFVATYAVVYATNVAGVSALGGIGFSPAISGALMMPLAAVLAFLLNKKLVFRHE